MPKLSINYEGTPMPAAKQAASAAIISSGSPIKATLRWEDGGWRIAESLLWPPASNAITGQSTRQATAPEPCNEYLKGILRAAGLPVVDYRGPSRTHTFA